uniref:Uncharacterized protein n=1 Tax=Panagrolaimus sp. PS1159 TaxID=55785 RepID=A0AC35EW88_9BILA
MSGNLRNALAMAFTRQQQRVNDAQAFLANNGNYTKARENEGLVLIGKLETSHREYDGIDKNWQALIATINDADEKDAEQKVYDQHAFDLSDPQKVPFNKIMADILEAASDIKVECNIIQQTLAAVALPVAPVVAT